MSSFDKTKRAESLLRELIMFRERENPHGHNFNESSFLFMAFFEAQAYMNTFFLFFYICESVRALDSALVYREKKMGLRIF